MILTADSIITADATFTADGILLVPAALAQIRRSARIRPRGPQLPPATQEHAMSDTIIFTHDPQAVRTYAVAWGHNLTAGDAIGTVSWTVPAGLTKVAESTNATVVTDSGLTYAVGTLAQVRLSGGTAGADYTLTCHIVTTAGDQDEQTVVVKCRDR